MWNPSRRTSGIPVADLHQAGGWMRSKKGPAPQGMLLLPLLLAWVTAGCNYTFQAGAGLPSHVRTVAVVPFENETDRFELTQEVHEEFMERIPQAFGVRTAGEEHADAVVEGSIRNYSVETPSFRPSGDRQRAEVIERQVTITLEIRVVDRANNLILWDEQSLSARGEYAEATELEEDGRRVAITRLAQAVIDGIQSNW